MAIKSGNIDPVKLTDFTTRSLIKVGIPEEDARITAKILVATDLRGIDSHGVPHLANFYIKFVQDGRVNPKPDTKIFSNAPATAVMDGDRGLGFVVGYRAMHEAIRRAKEVGAGFVSVRNSSHFGAGGNYAMMALEHDMIGISMTEGGKGMVAPGTVGRNTGINVISVAIPAGEEAPFVLDMATTVVANGKVEITMREGKMMPEGWAIGPDGKSITDPKKYYEQGGALLPLGGAPQTGGFKGFGLAITADILCRVLSAAAATDQMAGEHFFGALRIDGFQPALEFKKRMDELVRAHRSLTKAPGVERLYTPGEIEQEIEKRRKSEGIPLHPSVVASLKQLAQELGIEYNL